MKILLLILPMLFLWAAPLQAQSILTMPDCNQGTFATYHTMAVAGDTVQFPVSDACTWTSSRSIITKGIKVDGRGTTITENSGGQGVFELQTSLGQNYRITGFTFLTARTSGSGGAGVVTLNGNSRTVRIDNNTFTNPRSSHVVMGSSNCCQNAIVGVVDSNTFTSGPGDGTLWLIRNENMEGQSLGDGPWEQPYTRYSGAGNQLYFEDNSLDGSAQNGGCTISDVYDGGVYVARYNTVDDCNFSSHGSGDGAGNARGARWTEIYENIVTGQYSGPWLQRSGGGIYYNNDASGRTDTQSFMRPHTYRAHTRTCSVFGNFPNAFDEMDLNDGAGTPGGAGDGVYEAGTADGGSSNDLLVDNSMGWAPNEWIGYFVYVPTSSVNPGGYFGAWINSNTATTITTQVDNFPVSCPHTFVSGEAYEIKKIDLAFDGIGAGQTDNMVRSGSTPVPGELNQVHEPIYIWANQPGSSGIPSGLFANQDGTVLGSASFEDFHYFTDAVGGGYDGTSGIGSGMLASRPASPALLRTGYFATDSGPNGTLFVWNGSSWDSWWQPFTYPHPCTTGCGHSGGADTTNPTVLTLSPLDNDIGVAINVAPVITFDEPVVVGTGNITVRRTSDDVAVATLDVTNGNKVSVEGGTVTLSLTFDLPSGLTFGTEYYILIPATAFDDLSANSYAGIASTTAWSFTTASQIIPDPQGRISFR